MRRGSISSWEPWARRNSANMAQIAGTRSEFMTSDLGLNDIEYKRKGGCFLSYNKAAAIVIMFIVGTIVAGLIGAYISPWTRKQAVTALALVEEDEVAGTESSAKFSVSPSIYPTLYTVELTPVPGEISTRFKGRVIIDFSYNGSQAISQLVLNAKSIAISSVKLFSSEEPTSRNVHSRGRKRREDSVTLEAPSLDPVNSSDVTTVSDPAVITSPSPVAGNDTASTEDSSGVTLNIIANNATVFDDSSADNTTGETEAPSTMSTLSSNVVVPKDEKSGKSWDGLFPPVRKISVPQAPISSSERPEKGNKISTEISTGNNEVDAADGLFVIRTNNPISRGSYSVEITYETDGVDGRNTFANYYDLEGQKRWLLSTRLKPLGARSLFPGFHERNSRAKFSLSIARPKTLIALFNMPLRSSDSISENWTLDHFEMSPPLPPHGLAFVVSELQPIAEVATGDSNVPLTLWGKSNKIGKSHYVVDRLGTVTRVLSQYFSSQNPLKKLDVAALPRLIEDGSGSAGLIFVRESLFDVTEESSPILRKRVVTKLIKLMGEQWLGGLVSAKSWTEAWFLDGSLIYLQYLLADKIDPTIEPLNSIGILQRSVLEADAYQVSKSLKSRRNLASFESANLEETFRKGACLIRMMHGLLSDSGLRNGYKKFIARWGNAEVGTSDFFASMSSDEQLIPDGMSLTQVMTSWIDQAGFPVVSVTRNYETGSAVARQEQFLYENSSTTIKRHLWYIPVTYCLEGIDDWSSPSKFWFKQEPEVTLTGMGRREEEEKKKWLLMNVNRTGYYRVNYDEDNWNLLAVALNSTPDKFPVTTRTSLVDDALSLAWGKRLGYSTAFNLIHYLRDKESHHSPWIVAFENMVKINNVLYNTPAYQSFQEFMGKFISPLFKKVTLSDSDSELKLTAVRWACLIDNPSCRTYMKSFSSVPVYLEDTYQCAMARFGGKSEWDSMILKISNSKDEETKLKLFGALPCFQVEWILQSLLDGILKGGKFDETETVALLRSFGENPMAARSAFKFVRRNWKKIVEKYSKSYQISRAFLLASMKGVADDQDLKDFETFKDENHERLKFMGRTIAIGESEARARISWLKRNLSSVQAWMMEYVKRTS